MPDIIDSDSGEFVRACKDYSQAYELCRSTIQWSKNRQEKDAGIQRKLNDSQPFNQAKLNASAQGWRSNFSTGWLSSVIYRAIPNYKQVIDQAEVLTRAELADNEDPQNERISQQFQVEFTRMLRRWKEWNDFTYKFINENVVFGSAFVCRDSEFTWKPTFLRRDESYLPDLAGQMPNKIPYFVRIRYYLPHEMAFIIQDRESAEAAGWEIDNVVDAINAAKPENLKSQIVDNLRRYEDTIRQSTASISFIHNVKKIKVYELYIQEYATSKVSHYMVSDELAGRGLFTRLDQFNNMEECCSAFTIEPGDGSYYGSKGIGRALYNMAVKKDQASMLMLDSLYLGGLLMLRGTPKGKNKSAITINNPVIIVSEDFEVQKNELKVDVEAYQQLDKALNTIAEIRAGIYMPAQSLTDSPQDRRTASEVNYVASVEQQLRDSTTRRFWGQFQQMVFMIQKAVCSQDNIEMAVKVKELQEQTGIGLMLRKLKDYFTDNDESRQLMLLNSKDAAVEFLVKMLKFGATPEQLAELGLCPPQEITNDEVIKNGQAIDQVYQRYAGNPNINQVELIKKDLSAKLGNDSIGQLILSGPDMGEQAYQTREQIMELQDLMDGVDIPVAHMDDDVTHLNIIAGKMQPIMQAAQQAMATGQINTLMPQLISVFNHAQAHLQNAQGKKINPKILAPFAQQLMQMQQLLSAVQGVPPPPPGPPMPGGSPASGPAPKPAGPTPPPPGASPGSAMPEYKQATDILAKNPQPIPPNQGRPFQHGAVDLNTKIG